MEVIKKLESKDGSVKFLLKLFDSKTVEALYMYDKEIKLTYNNTVCISSQVGCKLGCKFCATGKQGFFRDLTSLEIFEQAKIANNHCLKEKKIPLNAVVFAGMGEPLFNYDNVKEAIMLIYEKLNISNFEIATVGVVPKINQMIQDFKAKPVNIRLNLSLHSTLDEKRKQIIPYASQYSINEIIKVAIKFAEFSGNKSRIRYALFKDINNTKEDAQRLCHLLKNKPLKLVLSKYNNNDIAGLNSVSEAELKGFYNEVSDKIECSIFNNFGSDIKGGCGQLSQTEALSSKS